MNNREELSEKCNPEKKEKGQKSKDIKYILQLNLFCLFYDKECLARWASSPKRGSTCAGLSCLRIELFSKLNFMNSLS